MGLWLPYLLLSTRVNVTYRRRIPACCRIDREPRPARFDRSRKSVTNSACWLVDFYVGKAT